MLDERHCECPDNTKCLNAVHFSRRRRRRRESVTSPFFLCFRAADTIIHDTIHFHHQAFLPLNDSHPPMSISNDAYCHYINLLDHIRCIRPRANNLSYCPLHADLDYDGRRDLGTYSLASALPRIRPLHHKDHAGCNIVGSARPSFELHLNVNTIATGQAVSCFSVPFTYMGCLTKPFPAITCRSQ